MIEPIQSRYPTLQPREFVRGTARGSADAGGCALIFDEVVTGFRIAPGGAQEFYGVRADHRHLRQDHRRRPAVRRASPAANAGWMRSTAATGSSATNSYPEAGVTYFAGTFVRHPLALAAAKAALTHLKQRGPALQQELNARTAALGRAAQHVLRRVRGAIACGLLQFALARTRRRRPAVRQSVLLRLARSRPARLRAVQLLSYRSARRLRSGCDRYAHRVGGLRVDGRRFIDAACHQSRVPAPALAIPGRAIAPSGVSRSSRRSAVDRRPDGEVAGLPIWRRGKRRLQ